MPSYKKLYCDFMEDVSSFVHVVSPSEIADRTKPAELKKMTRVVAKGTYAQAPDKYMATVLPCMYVLQTLIGGDDPDYAAQRKLLNATHVSFKYVLDSAYSTLVMCIKDGANCTFLVLFRGARNLADFRRASIWLKDNKGDAGTVQKGILKTFKQAFPPVKKKLERLMSQNNNNKTGNHQVIISGLSFGSAMAVLAARELAPLFPGRVNVVTFGGIRFASARFYEDDISRPRNFLRVFNGYDALVHSPPRVLGFRHFDEHVTDDPNIRSINCLDYLPASFPAEINKRGSVLTLPMFWHTSYAFQVRKRIVLIQSACP